MLYNIDAIEHDCDVNHACFNAPKTNYWNNVRRW